MAWFPWQGLLGTPSITLRAPAPPHPCRFHQADRLRFSLAVPQASREYPVAVSYPLEVFLLDPLAGLLTVASPTPPPEQTKDPTLKASQ